MSEEPEILMHEQIVWAHTYNGYERLAGGDEGPAALARLLEPAWREFERTGRVPDWCGVDLLRGWAFYLTRADRFGGGYDLAEGGAKVREWEAVLERIAAHPSAGPEDVPPLRNAPGTDAESATHRVVRVIDSPDLAVARRKDLGIDRGTAQRLGLEAVALMRQGWYTDATGGKVSLAASVEAARRATVSIPPESELPVPEQVNYPTCLVEIANETSLGAAQRLVDEGQRPLVLNMANGVRPGGGFLSGARAQEEYLCRSTALFATLERDPMYEAHAARSEPDSTDWAIVSPDVPVFRDDSGSLLEQPWSASFVTSAAPYAPVMGQPRAGDLLDHRIRRVLEAARAYGYSALVLGAWGCGAFGNDPDRTAKDFRRHLDDLAGSFEHVVFAITDWSEERRTLGPFVGAFKTGGTSG